MTHTASKYESAAEKAARIRPMLKESFPGVKFSVRSDYNSISIRWTDGPTVARVEKITKGFESISRDQFGEILSGGNLFVSCYREYSDAMRERAREVAKTILGNHIAFRYPEPDGSPNLHVVLGEMEGELPEAPSKPAKKARPTTEPADGAALYYVSGIASWLKFAAEPAADVTGALEAEGWRYSQKRGEWWKEGQQTPPAGIEYTAK